MSNDTFVTGMWKVEAFHRRSRLYSSYFISILKLGQLKIQRDINQQDYKTDLRFGKSE